MTETFEHGYALLIGVGDCQDSRLSLPVTVKDTQAIKKVLIDSNSCGYLESHINILNNEEATKEGILVGLQWLQEKAENDSKATVFVYYSGHGGLNKDNTYYLIPHDYQNNSLETAFSAKNFTEEIRKIQSQRLLVVIDSCHAGGMATSKDGNFNLVASAPSEDLIKTLTQGEGRAVFSSCRGEESSWFRKDNTMSIYTYHFLDALKGKGNKPGDTEVKLSDLMRYLSDKVSKTALQDRNAKQTPYFDFGATNFAISVLQNNFPLGEDIIYVERSPIETQACQANCKPGSLIRIKAPQKMGKTLLLNQILKDASNKGFKTIIFDFGSLTNSTSNDYKQLSQSFCFNISEKLELNSNNTDDWLDNNWKRRRDTNENTTKFLQDYLLPQISVGLVLGLENFDQVLENEIIRDEVCKLLRYWHVLSKQDNQTIWDKLHLIIIHSTDAYGKTDLNSSPLAGVGEYFELKMFNDQQIQELINKHDITLNDHQRQQLIDLIGGNPSLLVEAIQELKKTDITLEKLLEEATTESGIFKDYLRELLNILIQNNEMKKAYKTVINSNTSIELLKPTNIAFKLYSLGLVTLEGNMAKSSSNLYREYFKKYLS